jgi:hypothetical protein
MLNSLLHRNLRCGLATYSTRAPVDWLLRCYFVTFVFNRWFVALKQRHLLTLDGSYFLRACTHYPVFKEPNSAWHHDASAALFPSIDKKPKLSLGETLECYYLVSQLSTLTPCFDSIKYLILHRNLDKEDSVFWWYPQSHRNDVSRASLPLNQ